MVLSGHYRHLALSRVVLTWPLLPLFISPIRSECWPFLLRVKIDSHSTEIFFFLSCTSFSSPPKFILPLSTTAFLTYNSRSSIPQLLLNWYPSGNPVHWLWLFNGLANSDISIRVPPSSSTSTSSHPHKRFVNPTILVACKVARSFVIWLQQVATVRPSSFDLGQKLFE